MNWNKIASNGIYKGNFNTPNPVKQDKPFIPKVVLWAKHFKKAILNPVQLETQLNNNILEFKKKRA